MMAALLSACTDAALWLANLKAPEFADVAGIAYGDAPHQRYDFYASGKENATLIAFFYGGGWTAGNASQYRFVAQTLRLRGYDVAVVNYGLWPQHRYPDFVEDTALFLRYYQAAHPQQPVVAMGHSAGAYNVMMAAARGATAAKVIGISGPYAFEPETTKYRQIFAAAAPDYAAMKVPSAVTPTMPPVLLLHGREDGTVLPANTEAMAKALAQHGVAHEVVLYDDIGHYRIIAPFARLGWPRIGIVDAIDCFIRRGSVHACGPAAHARFQRRARPE